MTHTSGTPLFDLQAEDFGTDFVWGVSTAAYQIEGAYKTDGKGKSIWDGFVSKKGNIFQDQHGQIACDFYNRYKADILLMKSMNIDHFRFSLSWSRILPDGTGKVNQKGIDFYNALIDFCLECGITPWVTLYHWDLPQALEDLGGWTNRKILHWFEAYAQICAENFGDRVKHWMVLNEPMVFTGAGYFLGVHAPGKKGLKNFLPAIHHAVLCQALGGKTLRKTVPKAVIGTTFSCSQITPRSKSKKDIKAAHKADALLNRLFIEPSLGLGYPNESIPVLRKIKKYQRPEDAQNSVFEFDFIGIQNYTREVVRHSYTVPYLRAKIVKATERNVPTTLMDWEVYPPSIYEMLKKFNAYKGVNKILITENGAAFKDRMEEGEVNDTQRTSYLQNYLAQVHKARSEGLKVSGYFVWTFTDNFEWAEGYYPRFGLVHIDFQTLKRTIKASGKWYGNFLKGRKHTKAIKTKKTDVPIG
ncbi:GH1 family beta-glucosidase [Zobellia galactanivorans]|uniref:Beta-glucosidase n=1 Tax=Zobellia galactanivorans (strain DSM 12802 / CCUG 47099 / CIP 106680 / NCIMB 13871 / Dsij) TaxID=63186 RepID=G0L4C6_ZOBGA|nr:GH1 family beta-glucosidase [Zobellia galactanivorans]MDO6810901.1 GH1 family beta-glucosidase [Zobellia galactanivorans]CAZ95628.1 Beta-glucosidase, family GH1 [Zobellia galactanivorans]